jgi:hypothetical protein
MLFLVHFQLNEIGKFIDVRLKAKRHFFSLLHGNFLSIVNIEFAADYKFLSPFACSRHCLNLNSNLMKCFLAENPRFAINFARRETKGKLKLFEKKKLLGGLQSTQRNSTVCSLIIKEIFAFISLFFSS